VQPTTNSNPRSLEASMQKAHKRAMEMLADWFNNRCKEEIKSDKWKWPTDPKVRDIVNSGRLVNSQTLRRLPDGSFEVDWPVPYAQEVITGGVSPESGRFPARDFTAEPLRELPSMYAHFLKIALREQSSAGASNFSGIRSRGTPQ
jgi:hypothetical protein